jgi:hypothetical protein
MCCVFLLTNNTSNSIKIISIPNTLEYEEFTRTESIVLFLAKNTPLRINLFTNDEDTENSPDKVETHY